MLVHMLLIVHSGCVAELMWHLSSNATSPYIHYITMTTAEGEVRCRCQNGMAYKD
jgi:hypothetical protein